MRFVRRRMRRFGVGHSLRRTGRGRQRMRHLAVERRRCRPFEHLGWSRGRMGRGGRRGALHRRSWRGCDSRMEGWDRWCDRSRLRRFGVGVGLGPDRRSGGRRRHGGRALPRTRGALRGALVFAVFEAAALTWRARGGAGRRRWLGDRRARSGLMIAGLTVAGREAAGLAVAGRTLSGRKTAGRAGSRGLALRRDRRGGTGSLRPRRRCGGRRRLGSAHMQAEGRGRA